ncbi:hypothetical protein GRJ2_003053100 [Grus japonensis]|uniref:Secreted protein n=1 Tax=Grus japonensis TaxID=30415 RepID=A0ABC9Y9B1_GRUJA
MIASLLLLATLFPIQARMLLATLATLLAHIQLAIDQYPQVLFCRAAFQTLFPKPVALPEVVVTQVQDPALCLIEPCRCKATLGCLSKVTSNRRGFYRVGESKYHITIFKSSKKEHLALWGATGQSISTQTLGSDLDDRAECTLRNITDNTKLGQVADRPKDHAAIQRDLNRLES